MHNKRIITQHIKLISILLIGLSLSACSSVKPNVVNVSTEHINTCSEPPKAGQIVMRVVNPTVIEDKHGVIWIGISPKHYENLSTNIAGILEHIKKKNAVIKYYKKCNE